MMSWRRLWRYGMRVGVPALLVLHLAAVQAAMLTPAAPVSVADAAATTVAHCHDAPADETPAPVAADHCNPGHCHCPVAMTHAVFFAAGPASFLRRAPRGLLVTEWPSIRRAPDTRPPIAP